MTWPSACHLGNQSNRQVKLLLLQPPLLLLLQSNKPETATAAVIEATEEKVLP